MDGDRRIPCGGSLGCLPDLLLSGFGFVFGSRSRFSSSSFAAIALGVASCSLRRAVLLSPACDVVPLPRAPASAAVRRFLAVHGSTAAGLHARWSRAGVLAARRQRRRARSGTTP